MLIGTNNPIAAKIASVSIKGAAEGTEADNDHFGFVSAHIGSVRIAGVKNLLNTGAGNDLAGQLVGSAGDLKIQEVA